LAPSSVIASRSPRANSNDASVTMNGAMFVRAISRPLIRPINPHTANGSASAARNPYCEPQAASTPPRA
jgi:hypothetical protein